MDKIPIAIAKFLATPDKKGFAIHDKFAYLIKSADGDDYYFCEQLPEDGLISAELGDKLYELISNTHYEEIFKWYNMWIDCV